MSIQLYFANAVVHRALTDGTERFVHAIQRAAHFGLMEMERYLSSARAAVSARTPTMAWAPVNVVALRLSLPLSADPHHWLGDPDTLDIRPVHPRTKQLGAPLDIALSHPHQSAISVESLPARTREVELTSGDVRLRVAIERLNDTDQRRLTPQLVELLDPQEDATRSDHAAFFDDRLKEVFPLEAAGPETRRPKRPPGKLKRGDGIAVLGADEKNERLALDRLPPSDTVLAVAPNIYNIEQQLFALRRLRERPLPAHRPLLRLFERREAAERRWPAPERVALTDADFQVLTDATRDGTDAQRRFVEIALGTPDFALLEGPPGSGKTTVICELIRQLTDDGKRVLLCGSTHVAVDNVIERLKGPDAVDADRIHLVRIGADENVKRHLQPFTLNRLRKTWMKELKTRLSQPDATPWQRYFKRALDEKGGYSVLDRLILDTAQVICGTTIGILQHPDIKANRGGDAEPPFDVMILDEASKTPFPEFLVPALWARRWIIIGDPLQLSPYVETDWVEAHLGHCFGDRLKSKPADVADACATLFEAVDRPRDGALIVGVDDSATLSIWAQQAQSLAERLEWSGAVAVVGGEAPAPDRLTLATAQVVVGTTLALARVDDMLPLDATRFHGTAEGSTIAERRAAWFDRKRVRRRGKARSRQLQNTRQTPVQHWSREVAWRMVRDHELRRLRVDREEGEPSRARRDAERYKHALTQLMPCTEAEKKAGDIERMVLGVQQIALPSVLESLQDGVGRRWPNQPETALNDGLPPAILAERHIRLTHQHRMHPSISAFPRRTFYREEALHDASTVQQDRGWSYAEAGVIWHRVNGAQVDNPTHNPAEVGAIEGRLKRFVEWARRHHRRDGRPWEVAVLAFYQGQEHKLRAALRRMTKQHGRRRSFEFQAGGVVVVRVELCTVDRFQGHEADYVLLSCVRTHGTGFLDAPNRLNVALTRARHLLVVVGHHAFWSKGRHRSSILRALAEDMTAGVIDYDSARQRGE